MIRNMALAILLLAAATQTAQAQNAQQNIQKNIKVPYAYMFGFAASFSDSLVFFTEIQQVDSVWLTKKKGFLAGKSNYAYQLRNYCEEKMDLPKRTCVVVSSVKRKDVEKKYKKMMKKYVGKKAKNYDVRYISSSDFKFHAVDMSTE